MRVVVNFLVICIVSLLCGCSSNPVKYYEYYERRKSYDPLSIGNYCTLEVTKDRLIYRAKIFTEDFSTKQVVRYLYMEVPNEGNKDLVLFKDFKNVKILLNENPEDFSSKDKKYNMLVFFQGKIGSSELPDSFSSVIKIEDKKQFPTYEKKGNRYKKLGLDLHLSRYKFSEPFLDRTAIWFPPKFKRTRKINYSLFKVNKDLIDRIDRDSLQPGDVEDIWTFRLYLE